MFAKESLFDQNAKRPYPLIASEYRNNFYHRGLQVAVAACRPAGSIGSSVGSPYKNNKLLTETLVNDALVDFFFFPVLFFQPCKLFTIR